LIGQQPGGNDAQNLVAAGAVRLAVAGKPRSPNVLSTTMLRGMEQSDHKFTLPVIVQRLHTRPIVGRGFVNVLCVTHWPDFRLAYTGK
jgi:hypothetical protein